MEIDYQRRKTVMARSIKLGHCVCNTQQGCPCDTLRDHNVCPCAGEKMPRKSGAVALTRHVRKAGCASKIGQADLLRILGGLPTISDPNVLMGTASGDDAGIYRIDDEKCLVQTVDVFTPCVDDPYLFGQIAAANSISDVYAMGGRPVTALSIIGFPIDDLDDAIMQDILRGGIDKLAEAQCPVIGGHSINDEEIKFGFAVTGLIDSSSVVERDTAKPGDALVLTKPLGTGMISFAAQIGRATEGAIREVGASMAKLNKDAAELMVKHDANACTDVTGFGLMGHLGEMAKNSKVRAEIDMSLLPVFAAVGPCLENEVLSGAIERNQYYSMGWVRIEDESAEGNLPILYDPQTSGGLLVSLPEEKAKAYLEEMKTRGHDAVSIIGQIKELNGASGEGEVAIVNAQLNNFIGDPSAAVLISKEEAEQLNNPETPESQAPQEELSCCGPASAKDTEPASCCDSPPSAGPTNAIEEDDMDSESMFRDFLQQSTKAGLIDAKHKKLMAVALSVAKSCAPCARIHIKGAVDMGISKAEIDEAAWMAISFSGCTGMMFYKEICEELKL